MIFLSVIVPIFFDLFEATVVACDAEWMSRAQLEQMARAELSEVDEAERQGGVWTVDNCTEESARIGVFNKDGHRERVVSLGSVPEDSKLRTVVLALGDLARETGEPVKSDDVEAPKEAEPIAEGTSPPGEETQPEPVSDVAQPEPKSETAQTPTTKSKKCRDEIDMWLACTDELVKKYWPAAGVYFRGFPLAKSFAPEARFGFRTARWRFAFGGYGMGWRSDIVRTHLLAFTATVGPGLWRRQRKVTLGLDALMELGAAAAFGKTTEDARGTPKVNVVAGAHLSFWVNLRPKRRFQPVFTLEAGWVRGANVFVGNEFQGGFEGLSLAAGWAAEW